MPLGFRVVNLHHQCDMCHIMPCKIQGLLYAFFFHLGVWARNGVVHFVGLLWVIFGAKWQVEFPFGGSKQFCALQGTIFDVKTFYPWIRLYGLCLWISTLGNSLKLQWYWSMALSVDHLSTMIHNSQSAWRLGSNHSHAFVKTSCLCPRLLKPLVVDHFCKVSCWY